jgi:imidazolonepropionase-like amidohydrolase
MPIDTLITAAATAAREGMAPAAALGAVTDAAAKMLGLGRRLGKLARGYDGDAVVWSAFPLESQAKVVATIIGGEIVYQA